MIFIPLNFGELAGDTIRPRLGDENSLQYTQHLIQDPTLRYHSTITQSQSFLKFKAHY